MIRTMALTVVWFVAAVAGAAAQTDFMPTVRERIVRHRQANTSPIRVQVGVNFFLPGTTVEGEEAWKLRERARRTIYEMANRECALLLEIWRANAGSRRSTSTSTGRPALRWKASSPNAW